MGWRLLLGYIYHRRTLSFFIAQFTLWLAYAPAQHLIQFWLNFLQPAFYGFSIGDRPKLCHTPHISDLGTPRPLHAANSASPPGDATTFSTHSLPVLAVHRPVFPCGRFLLRLATHFLIAGPPRTALIPTDHSPMPTYSTRSRTHSVFAARCAGSFKQICIALFFLLGVLYFISIFSAY